MVKRTAPRSHLRPPCSPHVFSVSTMRRVADKDEGVKHLILQMQANRYIGARPGDGSLSVNPELDAITPVV